MRKIVLCTSLFLSMLLTGCMRAQLHQSLLIHENQRLEQALYAAHARVTDLKRENNLLRKQQTPDSADPASQEPWNEDWGIDPPIEMPSIIIPDQPGTTEIPDSIRGSQTTWSPTR